MIEPRRAWMPAAPMNLQLFAEEAGGEGNEGTQQQAQAPEQQTSYTREEVLRLIQSETDRRVNQARETWKKDQEKERKKSGMDDSQRTIAERDERISELEEALREANLYRARSQVLTGLSEQGMPASLADLILIDEDEDANTERVGKLAAAFNKAVEDAVKKRLAGGTPPAKGGAKTTMTREEIMNIRDPAKRQAAIYEHMDLFK